MSLFSPEALDLLGSGATGVLTILLPDGTPHSVVANVELDGGELVSSTRSAARRLTTRMGSSAISVVVVDPEDAMHWVEVRGIARVSSGASEKLRDDGTPHGRTPSKIETSGQLAQEIAVEQIRIQPTKVTYHRPDPLQPVPIIARGESRQDDEKRPRGTQTDPSLPQTVADGEITEDEAGLWVEFGREISHSPEEVWPALTDPQRLMIWQHPVQFLPWLRVGATIYARLSRQANVFALGKVTELTYPTTFSFRWTTNNMTLPPDFTIAYMFEDGVLRVRSGPFDHEHGFLLLAAALHIQLDNVEKAITAHEDDLAKPTLQRESVVSSSGLLGPIARSYYKKYPEFRQ
jgi:uncharacterized protein YndB with AHSA1/START domain